MEKMGKKTLLSGIQPTGRPHIGNYFGAMKQFLEFQETHSCFFMIADYHALNFIQNTKAMRENILGLALDYLAIGLDPKQAVIFKQSDVPQHAEMAWIFDTITTVPFLERAHPYDTAEKFNRIFGETFKLPEAKVLPNVAVVPGIDGRKMSKSYNNTIELFATDAEIEKAVMSIVTDSSAGVPKNVYEIHKLFRPESELVSFYQSKLGRYKDLKAALIADIKDLVGPIRERHEALAQNPSAVLKILKSGGEKAQAAAETKMKIVKERIGVKLY